MYTDADLLLLLDQIKATDDPDELRRLTELVNDCIFWKQTPA